MGLRSDSGNESISVTCVWASITSRPTPCSGESTIARNRSTAVGARLDDERLAARKEDPPRELLENIDLSAIDQFDGDQLRVELRRGVEALFRHRGELNDSPPSILERDESGAVSSGIAGPSSPTLWQRVAARLLSPRESTQTPQRLDFIRAGFYELTCHPPKTSSSCDEK